MVVRAISGRPMIAVGSSLWMLSIRDVYKRQGFAGPRVIEQTVREKLPEGFQRAEFLLQKGAIDMVVDRRQLREEIARLLALLTNQPADVVTAA